MLPFVRKKVAKTFVILAMLGMVVNSLVYAPRDCSCKEKPGDNEIAQAKSGCCNSQPTKEKSCCADATSCCCSDGEKEALNFACACGEDCRCAVDEQPAAPGQAPRIPSSNTQDSSKELAAAHALNFVISRFECRPSHRQGLKAPPGIYCSAQEMCALLSRFTC